MRKYISTWLRDPKRLLTAFIILHIVIFVVWLFAPYFIKFRPETYSFDVFWRLYSAMAGGGLPYIDFKMEYPPVAGVFIYLPGLLASSYQSYFLFFVLQIFVFDVIAMLLIAGLSKQYRSNLLLNLALYTLCFGAVNKLILLRYDFIPAVIALLAFYMFARGSNKIAWALTAVGFFTKIFPVLLAPLFLIYLFKRKDYRGILEGILTFAAVSLVIAVPVILNSPEAFLSSFTYHIDRGVHTESLYGSIVLLLTKMGLMSSEPVFNFGSQNIVFAGDGVVLKLAGLLTVTGMLAVYLLYFLRGDASKTGDKGHQPLCRDDAFSLVNHFCLVLLVFILFNKVFSPQFIIWPLTFICLYSGRKKLLVIGLFVDIALITTAFYSLFWWRIAFLDLISLIILNIRNTIMIVLAVLMFWLLLDKHKNNSLLKNR